MFLSVPLIMLQFFCMKTLNEECTLFFFKQIFFIYYTSKSSCTNPGILILDGPQINILSYHDVKSSG
jgi:hypothetical protein